MTILCLISGLLKLECFTDDSDLASRQVVRVVVTTSPGAALWATDGLVVAT